MSSGIILLLVAIVVLVIIAYLVGVIVRKRNDSLIASLEERKQSLFGLPVNEEVEAVKKSSSYRTKSNNIFVNGTKNGLIFH